MNFVTLKMVFDRWCGSWRRTRFFLNQLVAAHCCPVPTFSLVYTTISMIDTHSQNVNTPFSTTTNVNKPIVWSIILINMFKFGVQYMHGIIPYMLGRSGCSSPRLSIGNNKNRKRTGPHVVALWAQWSLVRARRRFEIDRKVGQEILAGSNWWEKRRNER